MLLSGKVALAGVRAQSSARPAAPAKPLLARRRLAGIVRAEQACTCLQRGV